MFDGILKVLLGVPAHVVGQPDIPFDIQFDMPNTQFEIWSPQLHSVSLCCCVGGGVSCDWVCHDRSTIIQIKGPSLVIAVAAVVSNT